MLPKVRAGYVQLSGSVCDRLSMLTEFIGCANYSIRRTTETFSGHVSIRKTNYKNKAHRTDPCFEY